MNAEIIAIGSELLLGQIIDTNSSYIAKCLADNGIELVQTSTVGDDVQRMEEVIREAIQRSQIIITTGGLGPTEDDLTREAIAETTQRPLVFQRFLMEQIEARFKSRGFRMTENNQKQAYIPEGAIPIENPKGTAPGFIVEGSHWVILSIPGVPSEMEYLMEHTVIPYLRKRFNLQQQIIRYRVLRACGLGEGAIGIQIKDLMRESRNPSVGTLVSVGDVKIRITVKADNPEEASILIQKMEQEIRSRLGILIYGVDNETLHGNIAKELERLNLTLSIVETFTGGIISQKLASTNSPSFPQGVFLPLGSSQIRFLKMTEEEFSVLSKEPKKLTDLLAIKVREEFETDLGLAMFGKISEDQGKGNYKGETFCSLSTSSGVENQEYPLGGELLMIRERASIIALDTLRKYLLKKKHSA
jgi:nicotinamide-nucleotide amidase